ncbi:MAG: hypothetical protein IKO27_07590 [Ruminococcus sp.]|nr:hypothetical protein [Ruminococcus sp.]
MTLYKRTAKAAAFAVFLLMITALMSFRAGADVTAYDLKVGGVRVTELNKDDILGNGEASFDPETNVLTLYKNITCSDENPTGCVENNISGLTVKAENRITLLRENIGAAIVSGSDITVTGKMDIIGGAGLMILDSQLTLKDADLDIHGTGWGIMGGLSEQEASLVIDNSSVHVKGEEDGAIVGFKGGIDLKNCDFSIVECEITSSGDVVRTDEETPMSEISFTNSTIYPLEISGVKVTEGNKDDILGDGEVSYDPESNTLTLNKDILCTADNTVGATPCIVNRIPGLTVKGGSGDKKRLLFRANFGAAIYSEKDITLTGNIVVMGGAAIVMQNSTLTVKDADILAGGSGNTIIGGMTGSSNTSKLVIDNSVFDAYSEEEAAVVNFGGGITLTKCGIATVDCYNVNGSIVGADRETPVRSVSIYNGEIYELEVAGIKVQDRNCTDILGNQEASYDPVSNTLTLKDDIVCDEDNTEGATPCIANRIPGLTVKGGSGSESVLLYRVNFGAAIYSEADITLTGNIIVMGGAAIVMQNSTLTVKDADITALGNANAVIGGMTGAANTSKLVINNSVFDASSYEEAAVVSFGGGITLTGCSIVEPSGGKISKNADSNYGITDSAGALAKSAVIKPSVKSISLKYSAYTYSGKPIDLDKYMTVKGSDGKVLTKDKDYTVTYGNNVKIGYQTASVTVTGTGAYAGTVTKKFTVKPTRLAAPKLVTKNGTITVKWNKATAGSLAYQIIYDQKEDFDTSSANHTKKYHTHTVTDLDTLSKTLPPQNLWPGEIWYVKVRAFITSDGTTGGTRYGTFSPAAKITVKGNVGSVSIPFGSYTYTGSAIKPELTVKDSRGISIYSKTCYTATYTNNTKVGKATITIKGIGDYQGTLTKTFVIKPKPGTLTLTTTSGAFKASWTKDASATGYQVQYSKNKEFKEGTVNTYTVSKNTTTSVNFSSKPKSGETWYVRYRAYVTVDGVKYGNYSTAKSIKVK